MIPTQSSGAEREIAAAVLREILLRTPDWHGATLDLASGPCGISLFLAELVRAGVNERSNAERARELIHHVASVLPRTDLSRVGLFQGLAGVSWAILCVAREIGDRELSEPGAHEAVVDAVLAYYRRDIEHEFDLIDGLAGIGLWAVAFRGLPHQEEVLGRVLRHLEASALYTQAGVKWRTPSIRNRKWNVSETADHQDEFNLGVAHGSPGVVAFLARCVLSGFGGDGARRLLTRAVRYLGSQVRKVDPDSLGMFGYTEAHAGPTRLAWCYGDAGIAVSLHLAARAMRCNETYRLASAVTVAASLRRLGTAGVVDAGLCHGLAGLVSLFSRLARFDSTGNASLAARYWREQFLCARTECGAFGGYDFGVETRVPRYAQCGFLAGAAGIGCALLYSGSAGGALGELMLFGL